MSIEGEGLAVVFDQALDGPAWPHLLGDRTAAFGEAWCGPLGLLARLETELGLVADHPTHTERALDLAQRLPARPGHWSESFDADPLATAKRLLADRDLLAVWGWNGQPVSVRLAALWQATADAAPGIPDRLRRILGLLPRRPIDLRALTLLDDCSALPPLWRELLVGLATAGVAIEHRSLPVSRATGDLAAARTSSFRPTGDGTLTMLRPQGPLAAAEEIAAALAACPSLDGIVIVGADGILDAALAHHGLPCLGQPRGATGSSALVRLVIETAFKPMDPDHLHALICADPGPIHGRLKRRLARALGKFPARGSAEWLEALEEGLANVEDEQRDSVAARVAALVDPVVGRADPLSLDQLVARMHALSTWAHGRATSEPSVRGAAVLADRLVTLARRTGAAQFDRTTLRRLVAELDAPALSTGVAEVGLHCVTAPGAVVGPARTIIWWNFTRASAPAAPRLRLSAAEQAALHAAGIDHPDPGALMASEARRWRRPLEQATDALVLVCPRRDDAGERAHPHPLWDELVATLPDGRDAAMLESTQVRLPATSRRTTATLRPVVAASASVRVPALALGETESPSSLETLMSCSLAWALQRKGMLWGGLGTGPGAPSPLHYGNIAHLVLEKVFGEPFASPDEAAARAATVFDDSADVLAEALHLPDFQTQRAEVRRGIVQSAHEVARIIQTTGASVHGLEVEVTGTLGPANVSGRTDLMLSGPDAIIDFKWGFTTYRELLKSGTAFQLVAYAALTMNGRVMPDIAYLTLQRQKLLGPKGSTLPEVQTFSHTASDMLAGPVKRLALRASEIARGELEAPSAIEDLEDGSLDEGGMTIVPKCGYCEFGALCGRRTRS